MNKPVAAMLILAPLALVTACSSMPTSVSAAGTCPERGIAHLAINNTPGAVKVRQGPTTNSEVIGQVPTGGNVTLIKTAAGWSQVATTAGEGWVPSADVQGPTLLQCAPGAPLK